VGLKHLSVCLLTCRFLTPATFHRMLPGAVHLRHNPNFPIQHSFSPPIRPLEVIALQTLEAASIPVARAIGSARRRSPLATPAAVLLEKLTVTAGPWGGADSDLGAVRAVILVAPACSVRRRGKFDGVVGTAAVAVVLYFCRGSHCGKGCEEGNKLHFGRWCLAVGERGELEDEILWSCVLFVESKKRVVYISFAPTNCYYDTPNESGSNFGNIRKLVAQQMWMRVETNPS
jgi:hypothetical protein